MYSFVLVAQLFLGREKRVPVTAIRSELWPCELTNASLELRAILTNLVRMQEIKA